MYCGQLKLHQQMAFEGFKQIAAIIVLFVEHESDKNYYFSKITIIYLSLLKISSLEGPICFL